MVNRLYHEQAQVLLAAPRVTFLHEQAQVFLAAPRQMLLHEQIQVLVGPDIVAPTVPTLTLAEVKTRSVALTIGPSTDAVGVAAYRVQRDGVTVYEGLVLEYLDAGLEPNTSYTYTASGVDESGNRSDESAPTVVTTVARSSGTAVPPPLALGLTSATALSVGDTPVTALSLGDVQIWTSVGSGGRGRLGADPLGTSPLGGTS